MPASNIVRDPLTNKILRKEYKIAERQFEQQILPPGYPTTTVWSYGPADSPWVSSGQPEGFNFPAYTIEAQSNVTTQITWENQLTAGLNGPYLPHLLTGTVDQTLHWANPGKAACSDGSFRTDCEGTSAQPYNGPVPMSPHVHGAHVGPESNGYPEAWWLPDASNIPAGYASRGMRWGQMAGAADLPGQAVFSYPNTQRAATLWYHDHSLGMTRQNVYAGSAGYYLVRDDIEKNMQLPGPAPSETGLTAYKAQIQAKIARLEARLAAATTAKQKRKLQTKINAKRQLLSHPQIDYFEIPILVQDRSFNADGSLFYPTDRAFFEGLAASQLQLPFEGEGPVTPGQLPNNPDGEFPGFVSDIAPIWNPEAFFNVNVVNGRAWPYMDVQPVRYRFRLLNGANSRTYNFSLWIENPDGTINTINPNSEVPFVQVGSDGGLLPNPVIITTGYKTAYKTVKLKPTNKIIRLLPPAQTPAPAPDEALLLMPAERADVIVDFSAFAPGTKIMMINTAPDAPYGGFPDVPADEMTTGKVMEFRVATQRIEDQSVAPVNMPVEDAFVAEFPVLQATHVRQVSLNENESRNLCVNTDVFGAWQADASGNVTGWMPCNFVTAASFVPFAPQESLLGTQDSTNLLAPANPLKSMANMTETPTLGSTELWEIFNNTEDAHPIHEHLVEYRIVNREDPVTGVISDPEPNELGWKDTVVAYPGQITRFVAQYDVGGVYVWHCHILEHEDNEMMRPYCVIDPLKPDCNGVP